MSLEFILSCWEMARRPGGDLWPKIDVIITWQQKRNRYSQRSTDSDKLFKAWKMEELRLSRVVGTFSTLLEYTAELLVWTLTLLCGSKLLRAQCNRQASSGEDFRAPWHQSSPPPPRNDHLQPLTRLPLKVCTILLLNKLKYSKYPVSILCWNV